MKKYVIKNDELPQLKLNYAQELNQEQYKVVTEGDGACLVLAGAGSGKTRTLIYRVAYLLEKGINPNQILLLTFTNKAAKEMLSRIELLLKAAPKNLWGGTFHHIGNRLLRKYGNLIGIGNNFIIMDAEDSRSLIKHCISQINPKADKFFPKPAVIQNLISLSINCGKDLSELVNEKFDNQYGLDLQIIKIANLYREKKQQANSLDYDDLLLKWKELLENLPEVKKRLNDQFRYILVDEYQDTNHLQSEIIRNMIGINGNILAVGDDAQSIYNFRGADVENILNFPKIFTPSKIFKLETNYRSNPEILSLANDSIKNNPNQFSKELKTAKPPAQKPALVTVTDLSQQANFICQRIIELEREENIKLSEIAVLFRSHFQSLELEMELNKRNIPYEMRGGLRFFEQAHIKDVIAFLRIIANLKDEVSWLRILNLQSGIGPAGANKAWQKISQCQDMNEITDDNFDTSLSGKALAGWQKLKNILIKIKNQETTSGIINEILKSDYINYLSANFENSKDRIQDLNQLKEFAESYSSMNQFLVDTALSEGFKGESITDYEEQTEAITLSTIHQAKGLEWRVVFVIGLNDGSFPHAKVYNQPKEIEEERRLFYVAVTRAKDQLYLTFPLFAHNDVICRMSKFVEELSPDLYEKWETSEEVTYEPDEN